MAWLSSISIKLACCDEWGDFSLQIGAVLFFCVLRSWFLILRQLQKDRSLFLPYQCLWIILACPTLFWHAWYYFMWFYDGKTDELLDKRCGSRKRNVEGISNQRRIRFKTDGSVTGKGWRLNWLASGKIKVSNRSVSGGLLKVARWPSDFWFNPTVGFSFGNLADNTAHLTHNSTLTKYTTHNIITHLSFSWCFWTLRILHKQHWQFKLCLPPCNPLSTRNHHKKGITTTVDSTDTPSIHMTQDTSTSSVSTLPQVLRNVAIYVWKATRFVWYFVMMDYQKCAIWMMQLVLMSSLVLHPWQTVSHVNNLEKLSQAEHLQVMNYDMLKTSDKKILLKKYSWQSL